MALSDSASNSIKKPVKTRIMVVRPYTCIKANKLLNISEIPLLSRKQTLRGKTVFDTYGSPRHLTIVSDFHTLSFRLLQA